MKINAKHIIVTVILVVVAVAATALLCMGTQKSETKAPTFLTKNEQVNIIESISDGGYDDFEDFYLTVYKEAGYDIPNEPISIWDAPISWEEKGKYIESVRKKTGDATHSDEFIMRTSFIGADIFTE